MKKRLGLKKGSQDKAAQEAFDNGIKHGDAKGGLKKYLDGLFLRNKRTNNMRVYNRKIWIFISDILITVIPLPNQYHKMEDKLKDK